MHMRSSTSIPKTKSGVRRNTPEITNPDVPPQKLPETSQGVPETSEKLPESSQAGENGLTWYPPVVGVPMMCKRSHLYRGDTIQRSGKRARSEDREEKYHEKDGWYVNGRIQIYSKAFKEEYERRAKRLEGYLDRLKRGEHDPRDMDALALMHTDYGEQYHKDCERRSRRRCGETSLRGDSSGSDCDSYNYKEPIEWDAPPGVLKILKAVKPREWNSSDDEETESDCDSPAVKR